MSAVFTATAHHCPGTSLFADHNFLAVYATYPYVVYLRLRKLVNGQVHFFQTHKTDLVTVQHIAPFYHTKPLWGTAIPPLQPLLRQRGTNFCQLHIVGMGGVEPPRAWVRNTFTALLSKGSLCGYSCHLHATERSFSEPCPAMDLEHYVILVHFNNLAHVLAAVILLIAHDEHLLDRLPCQLALHALVVLFGKVTSLLQSTQDS